MFATGTVENIIIAVALWSYQKMLKSIIDLIRDGVSSIFGVNTIVSVTDQLSVKFTWFQRL